MNPALTRVTWIIQRAPDIQSNKTKKNKKRERGREEEKEEKEKKESLRVFNFR